MKFKRCPRNKKKFEIKTFYKTDEQSLKEMEENLMTGIIGKISFNALMDKVEIAQERKLKQRVTKKKRRHSSPLNKCVFEYNTHVYV